MSLANHLGQNQHCAAFVYHVGKCSGLCQRQQFMHICRAKGPECVDKNRCIGDWLARNFMISIFVQWMLAWFTSGLCSTFVSCIENLICPRVFLFVILKIERASVEIANMYR